MTEIRTVTTLVSKRDAIERAIANYEAALGQARHDLAALNATIAHFQRTDEKSDVTPYFDLHRLFRRGEMGKLAKDMLTAEGPLTTTEIAERIVAVKGFDTGNHVLRKAVAYRLVHALRLGHAAGRFTDEGKRKNVRVWSLPS